MEITLTTPALLFPAISLLMVAYTNRFMTLGSRIRDLSDRYKVNPDDVLVSQVNNLKQRVILIRNMQAFGVTGLFCCVLCMFILFAGKIVLGKIVFGMSLICMLISLGISLKEVLISVRALNIELQSMENYVKKRDE